MKTIKEKSRIFIGSSRKALNLARALQIYLRREFSVSTIWIERTKTSPTASEKLMQAAREEFDFAAIILTRDDLGANKGSTKELRQDTLNCFFEAGLFMGALGEERCFLISNVEHENVPSDLQNLDYYNIAQPDNLDDFETCRKSIDDSPVIDDILQIIQEKGRFEQKRLIILSFDDLLEKERPKTNKGELESGPVVYLIDQPMQVNFEVAQQIRDNLRYGLDYFYFLPATEYVAVKICELLQMIILADFAETAENFDIRKKMIRENKEKIEENLKDVIYSNNLNFCLLPDKPLVFELVIHEALDFYKAKIYLKYGDQFVEWVEGQDASIFWRNLAILCPKLLLDGLFYSTVLFDPKGEQERGFKNILDQKISKYFPDINEKVKELFYEH
jgi:hypothetical protein